MVGQNELTSRVSEIGEEAAEAFSMADGIKPVKQGFVKMPPVPWRRVGQPMRFDTMGEGVNRSYRASYDWKAYSPTQLKIMERYWDQVVEFFLDLFPTSHQDDPKYHRGINLGTFNGCFQKAWMRRGFQMYGIEIENVIDELHEYGCEGHRGSVSHMPEIPDAAYDFAILDRVICGDKFYAEYDKPLQDQPYVEVRDPLGNAIRVPPFFAEIFRTLKPGGVLIAVLYQHWSERIIDELNTYGRMTFWPVEAYHPWLAVRVEKGKPPLSIPRLCDVVADTFQEFPAGNSNSLSYVAERLAATACVYHQVRVEDERIRFLYLPTNHLIDLQLDALGKPRITSDLFWEDAPGKERIFLPPVPAVMPLHEKRVKERRTSLLILTDMPGYPRKLRRHEKFLAERFARYTEVYDFDGPILGSAHAVITVEKVVRDVRPGMVLVGLGHVDTQIRVRNDRPRLSIGEFVSNLEAIFTRLHQAGFMPVFFDALPIGYHVNDASLQVEQRLKKRHEVTSSYNRAARHRLAELGFSVIPLDEVFLAHSRFYAKNGESLSKKGLQHLLHRLDAFAERRIKMVTLAAARGESVVETQQRFNDSALVQELPDNYPPFITNAIGIAFPRAGVQRIGIPGFSKPVPWVQLENGRNFYGLLPKRNHRRAYRVLGDLMAPALSEDLCLLAMDVASRYVKVKEWSWYPTELLPEKGGTIVEVGAYLGHKTVAFVDYLVGPNGRVLAIEAMPDNHELLELNIEKNQLADTVDVLHCGVWSSSGHKELMAGGSAHNSLVDLDHRSMARRITIPVDTLDHILVNWHSERIIDFLDIRVNGAEVEVLEGLKEQLERVRVVFVAAPYSVQGERTYDQCREILTRRGCLLLPQTTKTALYATPRRFAEEVLETPPLRVG